MEGTEYAIPEGNICCQASPKHYLMSNAKWLADALPLSLKDNDIDKNEFK